MILSILVINFLTACTHCLTTYRYDNKSELTTVKTGSSVAVITSDYAECEITEVRACSNESKLEADGWHSKLTPQNQEKLSSCVHEGIDQSNRSVRIILLGDSSEIPGLTRIQPVSAEKPPVGITNQNNPVHTYPDYLVRISARTIHKKILPLSFSFEHGNGLLLFTFGWMITKESYQSTTCSADLIDLASSRSIGQITVESSGRSSWNYPFLIIVPLPPFPKYARTEETGCGRLGELVGMILSGDSLNSVPLIKMLK